MKAAIVSLLLCLSWLDCVRNAGGATPDTAKAAPVSAEEAKIIGELKAAKSWFEKEREAELRRGEKATPSSSETYPEFHRALIKASSAFPLLDSRALPSTNRFFKLKLNARGAGVDGIRFKNTTGEAKNLGWIFALERPSEMTHWHIIRTDNVPMEGFDDFFPPRVPYTNAPWRGSGKNFLVTVQWLRNGGVEPGAEYLIWFVFQGAKPIDAFIGFDLFPATEARQNDLVIEDALGLKSSAGAPPKVRIDAQTGVVEFETASPSTFAIQSKFTGTAVVTGNVIQVKVDSGMVSNPTLGKEGDRRTIEEYQALLVTSVPGTWERISQSEVVKVQKDLLFGKQFSLPTANLTIPLKNIGDRADHWLVFSVKHVASNRPAGGYTFSHSRKDLFPDLPIDPKAIPWQERQGRAIYQVTPFQAFVLGHWTNFPMVTFLPPTNKTETAFLDFNANDHVIGEFQGRRYTGVRFTLPRWLDGDFEYAFVHVYRNAQEQRERGGYSWQMTTEPGHVPEMGNTDRVFFNELPEMHERFPFTEKGYTGAVRREFLQPGQTYLFWWSYTKAVVPDMALAFTIISDRGRKEFGEITWR